MLQNKEIIDAHLHLDLKETLPLQALLQKMDEFARGARCFFQRD